ncbi:MAG: FAD:protein FMN transferase, partial [Planctomycetota bacterium]
MMEIRHRAMACDFVVLIKDAGHDVDAAIAALESIDQIESRLTIYSRDSEISRLNDADSDVWTPLSRDTFELLCHAIELAHQTGGAFDVTSGPLVDVWGFTQRSGRKPSSTEIEVAIRSTGVDGIEMNEETRSARLTKSNMKLNLGAIGKGHAVDWLADQLLANGLSDFLIHAGQSSVFAWGNQFDDADQGDDVSPGCAEPARRGWMVGLAHP